MFKTQTMHVFPEDHFQSLEFVCFEEGIFDDRSIGFISAIDIAGDEVHLPNVKSSAIVKFFADFIQIEDVLREDENGGRASDTTMGHLRRIKYKLDQWFEPHNSEEKK